MKRLILIFLLLNSPALATTYYTAKDCSGGSAPPNCSDANNGLTRQTAELTIAAGLAHLAAGDTLIIGDGTYTERISNTIPAGSSGSLTTIQAENEPTVGSKGQITANVVLQPSGGSHVVINTHAYVKLHGLDIDATNADGLPINGYNGSTPFNGNVIEYNRIHGGNDDTSPGSQSGILGDFSNATISHNEVDHNGNTGGNSNHGIYTPGPSNTISYNYIHDNAAYCLQIYPSANSNTLYGNRCESNDNRGIIISGNSNLFFNNIEDSDSWGLEVSGNSNLIYNNTFYNNGHGAGGTGRECVVFTSGSSNQAKNNICYLNEVNQIVQDGGTATSATNLCSSGCSVSGDPSFTNAGTADFTLQGGSSAIDAGTTLAEVTGDFVGHARPVNSIYDIGAYEYDVPSTESVSVTSPVSASIQQRPDTVSIGWTTTNISAGTMTITYSFDGFITSYPITTAPAWNASPYSYAPTWPAQTTMQVKVCRGVTCGTSAAFVTRGQYLR